MAHAASARRGQPVVALIAILVGWIIARAAFWTPDMAQTTLNGSGMAIAQVASGQPVALLRKTEIGATGVKGRPGSESLRPVEREAMSLSVVRSSPHSDPGQPRPQDMVLARQMAQSGGLIRMNPAILPPRQPRMERTEQAAPVSGPVPMPLKDDPRWSSDRWLLMRRGSGAAAQAPGAASYGASQAGAVVRYRFGKGGQNAAYGYLRTSLAINAPGKDKEIALGLGARPSARIPLRVLVEARLQDTSRGPMRVRPVATVVTELPWQKLPLGFRAEAYGQAGYAGGRDHTAFFDAQGLVDRPLPYLPGSRSDFRLGAGFWAGGQKGAVRLDVGPRVSFALDLGEEVPSRIALDWRFRVAGNARPGSGPAITIASSF